MKLIKEIPNLSGLSCLNGLNGKPNSEQLFNRPPEGLGGGGEGRCEKTSTKFFQGTSL